MNVIDEINAVELESATMSCESGVQVIHPAFIVYSVVAVVMVAA